MSAKRQVCSFRLDGQLFGIPVEHVQEVLRTQELAAVPLAPSSVAGLVNLRGHVVTVVDLRTRIGLARPAAGGAGVQVIVRTPDGPVGLLVDEIGDVIDLDETAFETPPETLQGEARTFIGGAYKLQGRLLLALDLDRTLSSAGTSGAPARTGARLNQERMDR
jgi:purine-binding chemotaxis protein CheW